MHGRRTAIRPRKIELHKPLPIHRSMDDVFFEDETGNMQRAAASGPVAPVTIKPPRKINLLTPIVADVTDYGKHYSSGYDPGDAYVLHWPRPPQDVDYDEVDYDLQKEDMDWLRNHVRWGPNANIVDQLSEDTLERIIDIMEKRTAMGSIATMSQLEPLLSRYLKLHKATHGDMLTDVHKMWKSKRSKLGKPLLKQFWSQTSVQDTNPHHVFRPREKEKYRLRKHKKDDVEAFHKLQQLRMELHRGLELVELTRMREQSKRELLDIAEDQFNQAMHDLLDKSGKPYEPVTLLRRSKTRQMLNIPDRSSSRHVQESRAEASAPSPSAPLPPEQSIPQQPSVTANISLSSLFAPPVRGVDVDPAYPDGLQLGLALGLPIHEDVDADGAPVYGDRVARDDVGGMSVVAGVGRRGPAWEQREGLIPGVGSEAGQGRGGVLNAQPEAQPPPMEEYPPPPSSWRPWSAHDPDNVPAIARVAGAGVAAGGSSQRRLAVSPINVAAGGAGSGSADVDMGATDGGGAGSAGGDGPPRPATKKQRCGRFIVRPRVGRSGRVILDRIPLTQDTAVYHAKSLARFRHRHFVALEAGLPVGLDKPRAVVARDAAREAARASFDSRFSTTPGYGGEPVGVFADSNDGADAVPPLVAAPSMPGVAPTMALPADRRQLRDAPAVVVAGGEGTVSDPALSTMHTPGGGSGGGRGFWRRAAQPSRLADVRPMLKVNRKKLLEVCHASDSEDEGLVAMWFAGLSGSASLGPDLDEWAG